MHLSEVKTEIDLSRYGEYLNKLLSEDKITEETNYDLYNTAFKKVYGYSAFDDGIKRIINEWLHRFPKKYAYASFEIVEDTIIIYTQYPGILIGYHGKEVDALKSELESNGIEKSIKFIELGSHPYRAKEIVRR